MRTRSDDEGVRRPTPGFMAPLPLALALALTWGGCLPSAAAAQTILNVERLQPGDVELWHWGVEGALSLADGNSEYADVQTGVVLGYRWPRDWVRMFAGLDYRSETGEKLENDRYLHVRYNRWWTGRWQTFHFVQLQASHQDLLQSRILAGSGVRRRLLDGTITFDVGTGVMYEREELDADRLEGDHPVESRVWRMANLAVATRQLTESVRLLGLSYIQPDLADFDDLRTLSELSLLIELTETVDLTIRGEWRRDSRPPQGVEEDDLVLRTGFAVTVR